VQGPLCCGLTPRLRRTDLDLALRNDRAIIDMPAATTRDDLGPADPLIPNYARTAITAVRIFSARHKVIFTLSGGPGTSAAMS